jgi:hypothetical protein
MYRDFDNFENGAEGETELNCFTCPYFFRPYPANPPFNPPPQGQPQYYHHPDQGEMNNQGSGGRPPGPPPTMTPNKNEGVSLKSVSPGSIKPCTYRYVYIWLENGNSYWAWLTRVDRRSASGYRWDRRSRRWVYFGVDLRTIDSFECY